MKRRWLLVAIALLVSVEAALLPAVGQAHPSAYCGHGSDGYTITSRYIGFRNQGRTHVHIYEHRRWNTWVIHYDEKVCHPFHH